MSPVNKMMMLGALILAGMLVLGGCGSSTPNSEEDCTFCHAKPPSGTAAPNRSGAHAVHNALSNVTNVCDTCHNGAGSGTPNHNNGTVDVMFLSAYNAKSGAATYDAASNTCSKVSCHGGQTTPDWLTGTINVSTQCTSCHSYGTSEYNSFVSGEHSLHVISLGIACTVCHDTTKLVASHFTTLNTTGMEGQASATLNNSLNYEPATFSCTPSCHGIEYWQ